MSDADDGWRALPKSAIAALYVNGIQKFVRENLIAFFGAGTGFAVSESLGWREFGLAALLVLLAGLLVAVIYHRRFRYRVGSASVRVRKGLFEQQEIKVGFERVQNVGFSQPFYLRPLGLIRVALETPGAAQTEVNLPGIPSHEAVALRDRVAGTQRSTADAESDAADSDESGEGSAAFRAGAADLFLYGLTSNQVWILLALFGAPASNWVEGRVSTLVEQAERTGLVDVEALAGAPLFAALLVLGGVVALALVIMVLSGVIAVIRYHGFRLTRDDDRFKARFGLLEERERTLRIEKLHSVELQQTAIGRLLGQWHAVGHQTGSQRAAQQVGHDRRFLVPGIDKRRLAGIAGMLCGIEWSRPDWVGIDRRFRSMLVVRVTAVMLVLAAVSWWVIPGHPPWVPGLVIVANLLAVLMIRMRYRRWGYSADGDRLRIRNGLVGQTILDFDMARCQQVGISTSPYQRRHGLASLTFRLPHGDCSLPYLPAHEADRLANLVLYRVERSRTHGL